MFNHVGLFYFLQFGFHFSMPNMEFESYLCIEMVKTKFQSINNNIFLSLHP